MKRSAAIFILSFALLARAVASIDKIQEPMARAIAPLEGIQYKSQCYEMNSLTASNTLIWSESARGKMYKFSFEEYAGVGSIHFASSRAFDGARFFRFFQEEGLLITKRSDEPLPSEIKNQISILAPYEFLLNRKGIDIWGGPVLMELRTLVSNNNFASSLKFLREQIFESRNCMVVRTVEPVLDRFVGVPINYEVFLSIEDDYFPIAWSAVSKDNKTISSLRVLDFGFHNLKKGGKIRMPHSIQINYFALDAKKVYDKPTNIQIFRYSDVNFEADDYIIDPSIASTIYDADEKKSIQVPK